LTIQRGPAPSPALRAPSARGGEGEESQAFARRKQQPLQWNFSSACPPPTPRGFPFCFLYRFVSRPYATSYLQKQYIKKPISGGLCRLFSPPDITSCQRVLSIKNRTFDRWHRLSGRLDVTFWCIDRYHNRSLCADCAVALRKALRCQKLRGSACSDHSVVPP
jgi:hypothetical protein